MVGVDSWVEPKEAHCGAGEAPSGAKPDVAGSAVCPCIKLFAVLLVFEGYGDEFSYHAQSWIGMFDDAAVSVPKHDVPKAKRFGFSRVLCFDDLARASGEEESADEQVDGVIVGIGLDRCGVRRGTLTAEAPEELRCYRFLPLWWCLDVVHGFQEGFDGGLQALGAVLEVKGASLETQPKRLSQIACGCSDSRRRQRCLTWSKKVSCSSPFGRLVGFQERPDEEFAFPLGKVREEGVQDV